MSSWKSALFLSAAVILTSASCANILQEMAPKTSDSAIYFDAKRHVAKGEWALALTKIATLSAEWQAKKEVKTLQASAYAGRCGLDFIDLQNKIQNTTGNLFTKLMVAFKGAAASQTADCVSAETILKSFGATAATRTGDENMMMSFVSLAKIGTIMAINADANADGTLDPTFTAQGDLSNADKNEVVTGVSLFLESMTGALAGIAGAALTELQTACAGQCTTTDSAGVSPGQRTGICGVIRASTPVGLSICVGDSLTCAGGCP